MSVWQTPQATSRTSTSPGPRLGQLDLLHHQRLTELLEHRGPDLHRAALAASDSSPASVWLVAELISHAGHLPGRREAAEVDDLVVARAARAALGVGAGGPFDEHLERAPDEALGALAGASLDDLDQPLHPRDLHRVGHRRRRSISAASVPRRGEKTNVKALS